MAPPTRLSVLFIGNSFTARNDVPRLIAAMAKARCGHLEHRLVSVGGASLKMHWNKGVAQKLIAAGPAAGGPWDYVVLQEQSTLPAKNAARMHESVRLFDAAIRGAGSRTGLYMTWARRHAPESQQKVTDAYTSVSQELGATLVPAGLAWQRFLASYERPVLHDKDGSHPTLAGSYLAACVFYGVLFGASPIGLPAPDGLTIDDARLLQPAAADAIAVGTRAAAGARSDARGN